MKINFPDKVLLILWGFCIFWLFPAFLTNKEFDVKTREAESFLQGRMCLWFKHHGKTYGCIAMNEIDCGGRIVNGEWEWGTCKQTYMMCSHNDSYETDTFVQNQVKVIKELR